MPRPKPTEPPINVHCKIPAGDARALQDLAQAAHLTFSDILRRAIREWLAEQIRKGGAQ